MSTHRILVIATSLALHLGLALPAMADTTLTFSDSRRPEAASFLVHDGRVLMQGQGPDGERYASIYDSRKKHFIMIDHQRRQWFVMDDAAMQRQMDTMKRMRDMVRQQMEARLAQLPPEQQAAMRKRMEAMFAEPAPVPAEPKHRVRDTGRDEEVNGIRCRVYVIEKDGKPVREACMTAPKALGMPAKDYDTLRSMFGYMDEMAERMSRAMGPMAAKGDKFALEGLEGIPVRVRHLVRGNESRLEGLSTSPIDPRLFEVPAGFKKIDPFAEMEQRMQEAGKAARP